MTGSGDQHDVNSESNMVSTSIIAPPDVHLEQQWLTAIQQTMHAQCVGLAQGETATAQAVSDVTRWAAHVQELEAAVAAARSSGKSRTGAMLV